MPIKITDPELTVLEVLWKRYPMSEAELVNALAATGWKMSTIHNLLRQMCKKGVLADGPEGYHPLFSRSRYRDHLRNGFIQRWYKGSVSRMMRELLQEEALTPEDVQEIRRMLNASADNMED